MGEFCLLVDLHREGVCPAACAAGLFLLALRKYEVNKHEFNYCSLSQIVETFYSWAIRAGAGAGSDCSPITIFLCLVRRLESEKALPHIEHA